MSTSCTLRTRKFMSNRLLKRRQFVSVRVVLIFASFSKASLRPLEKSSSRAVSEISAVESRGNRSTCEVFNPTVSLLLTLIFFSQQILDGLHPGRANVPKVRTQFRRFVSFRRPSTTNGLRCFTSSLSLSLSLLSVGLFSFTSSF